MDMEIWKYIIIGIATFLASAINALAGGGTLLTFPVLTAMGLPAVVANVTNHVALFPGYLGAAGAQWDSIKTQKNVSTGIFPQHCLAVLWVVIC